jgi:hypothetical protein
MQSAAKLRTKCLKFDAIGLTADINLIGSRVGTSVSIDFRNCIAEIDGQGFSLAV